VSTLVISSARAHEIGRLAQDLAALEGRHPAPRLEAFVDGRERLIEVVPGDIAWRHCLETWPSSPMGLLVAGLIPSCLLAPEGLTQLPSI
jgi:hypothetical protein